MQRKKKLVLSSLTNPFEPGVNKLVVVEHRFSTRDKRWYGTGKIITALGIDKLVDSMNQ